MGHDHHGYCRLHRRARRTVGSSGGEDHDRWLSSSFPYLEIPLTMFLPKDLTSAESDLLAAIKEQLYSKRSPQNPTEERTVEQEAIQLAAEMIWEARGQAQTNEWEEEETEDDEESPYQQYLGAVLEDRRAIQEAEDRELAEEEAQEVDR